MSTEEKEQIIESVSRVIESLQRMPHRSTEQDKALMGFYGHMGTTLLQTREGISEFLKDSLIRRKKTQK